MQSLMTRHQDSGANADAVQFVQPRPRARFQTDSVQTDFADNRNAFSETDSFRQNRFAPSPVSMPPQDSSSFFQSRPAPPVTTPADHFQNTSFQTSSDAVIPPPTAVPQKTAKQPVVPREQNSRIEELLHRLHIPQQQAHTGDLNPPQIQVEKEMRQKFQVHKERGRFAESMLLPTEQQQSSLADKHSYRIEEILHRLNTQQPQQPGNERGHQISFVNESQRESQSDEHKLGQTERREFQVIEQRVIPHPSAENSNSRIEEILDKLNVYQSRGKEVVMPLLRDEARSVAQTEDDRQQPRVSQSPSSPPASSPAGLLELPDWLNGLQSELQNRWQETSDQVKTEPVINVSIGRVEVRAMQEKTDSKSKARPQPRGVMSLDEYLKQRENRR